jgi:hypothetical protein
MWMWHIVDGPYIIALFEKDVSEIQYICEESMSFDIDLEYTLHIHKLDIIDQYKTRVDEDDRMI